MAQATMDQDPGLFETGYDVTHTSLAASTTVPAGTLAMNDAGVVKQFTSAGYVGGAALLGVACHRMENATASPLAGKYTFRRGCSTDLEGKAGDLPTAAEVGKTVYVSDNFTVQKTAIVSGLAVTLVAIKGNVYRVQLP